MIDAPSGRPGAVSAGADALVASRSRSLAAAAVLAVLAFVAVYAVAVQTAWGQRQDEDAALGRYVSESAHDDVALLLSTISVASLAAIGGGIMLLAFLRHRPHLALGAGVLVAGAVLTAEILKRALPRPELLVLPGSDGPSFPSGHTTVALSLALALTLVVPVAIRSVVAIAGLAYALAIGAGVVSVGWHRPSDVLGAYLLTFAWAAAVCAVLVRRYGPGRDSRELRGARGLGTGPLLVGAGIVLLAVAALAAAAVVLERRREGFERLGAGYEFALACLVVAALGAGLVGVLLWLLRGISLDRPPAPASRASRDPVDV